MLPAVKSLGYIVPRQKALGRILCYGVDPLPRMESGPAGRYGESMQCTFEHFLNILWHPLIEHVDSLGKDPDHQRREGLDLHHKALVTEMEGIVPSPDETMDMDAWVEYIQHTLLRILEVHVPSRLILQVVAPIVPLSLQPTAASALHLLRSSLCSKLVGPAMAEQANRKILAEISEVPVKMCAEQDMNQNIRRDLIALLEERHCGGEADAEEDIYCSPLKKMRKDLSSRRENLKTWTKQVLWMLENRVAASRACTTLCSASQLLSSMSSECSSTSNLEELLAHRVTLGQHLLVLDAAVDRCTSEHLLEHREEGTLAGVALVTDESPPSQPRFRGLRFQITVLYWGTYLPESSWDSSADPPIVVTSCMGDICHCPGKKGVDVSRVTEKQLSRVGLNGFDVCSGTGDGGGENEGHQGVHAYYENLNPGYVRRRCVPHIAWRTCDSGIRASGLDYKALAAYLCEGVTWSRLREIATKGVAEGGLALFREGSQQCKDLFGTRPDAICTSRPDTDLKFLKLLAGKEHLLHKLAVKDLEQRTLSSDTRAAIVNLGNIDARINRRILQEILEKCLFLLYYNSKHPSVASSTSWDVLMQRAVSEILNLDITEMVLKRFALNEETLGEMEERPKSWVALAVLQVMGEERLVGEKLQEALDFHRLVSDQAAAHLNLVSDNTYRTPWLAAKLLSKDKALAQDSAALLVKHLATTRPSNRTSFEKHLFTQEELWKNLEDFSNANPPDLLWQGHGKYLHLFKFLAPRFLLAPDHVLDAERIHARWQWLCRLKRAMKLQTLNATLRLMHHLEHNQTMPDTEILLEHLEAERQQHRMAMEAVQEDVALGWR